MAGGQWHKHNRRTTPELLKRQAMAKRSPGRIVASGLMG